MREKRSPKDGARIIRVSRTGILKVWVNRASVMGTSGDCSATLVRRCGRSNVPFWQPCTPQIVQDVRRLLVGPAAGVLAEDMHEKVAQAAIITECAENLST
jgi:hypothetical protein